MSNSKPPVTPYVGLAPYYEKDAPFFFGREPERDNIISNLMGSRLTVLYGPSGVGKSSVLNAGVAFHMRQLSKLALARTSPRGFEESVTVSPSPEFFVVVFSKWREHPMRGLIEQIKKEVGNVLGFGDYPDEAAPSSLVEILRTFTLRTNRDFFIILDQFEDYFVYPSQEEGPGSFDYEFLQAVNEYTLRVNFLISIKEDALAKLDRFAGHIPNLFNHSLRIEHLSRDSAWTAIKRPIDKFNQLCAARGWQVQIEPQLIETVLDQVGTGQGLLSQAGLGVVQDGGDVSSPVAPIEPTYLQLVMTRLWDEETKSNSRKLQLSTLTQLGGARHIVKTHLDQIMRRLESKQRKAAMQMFVHLVSPTGNKSPQSLDDLALSTRLDRAAVNGVLTTLSSSDVRVLRAVESPGTTRYEIFHDVLVPAILRWRTKYELDRQRKRARVLLISAVGLGLILLALFLSFIQLAKQKREIERAGTALVTQRRQLETDLGIRKNLDESVPYFKAIMRGHTGAVNSAAFGPNDALILTGSDDGTAKLWKTKTGELATDLPDHGSPITNAEFSPDGKRIVTADKSGAVRLWEFNAENNTVNVEEPRKISAHSKEVNCASFSPNSKRIATSSVDGTAKIWDAETGKLVQDLRGHAGLVNCSFFSPNSELVVTASVDGTARIWIAETGIQKQILAGHKGEVNRAVFDHHKGELVATASSDGTARIWTVGTGKYKILRGHLAKVNSIAFSPKDDLVVTSSDDKTARVWDVNDGHMVAVLEGHNDAVVSARFSPDGQKVVTASEDDTARVWDVHGQNLAELRGHTSRVNSARFSSKGNLVATSCGESPLEDSSKEAKSMVGDTTARVWDVQELGQMRIEDVVISADKDYFGPCPGTISFFGKITVAGSGGDVQYHFVRDKGKPLEAKTLKFESPGSKDVSLALKLGGPHYHSSSGSVYLEVLSPVSRSSASVPYTVECELCGRQAPSTIPPNVGALTSGSQREITLGWRPVDEAAGYKIEVQFQKGANKEWLVLNSQPMMVPASETSKKITLDGAKRVRWRICSTDSSGRDCEGTKFVEIPLP